MRSSPVRNPQVGKNVRRLRRRQGLSIRKFCAKMKPPIESAQLLATELGRQEPTLEMILRYAAVLKVPVGELVEK